MILSGKEIEKRIGKDIFIEPFNQKQLNPNSYNLKLHKDLLVYKADVLDMKQANEVEKIEIPDEGFVMQPGKLYLGRTEELTKTENHVPMLEGRSSIGRLGIFIHITAGLGNVGANGYWTLELACIQPVKIYAGVEICQIFFHEMTGEFVKYNSLKYHNNNGIQPSLIYKEF
ncbi:MAG: dCTP deaminase [Flammeovirgaceae bacterium]|nr:dCTP deaminase [Flammeovirgaceae bacterium]